MRGGDYQGSSLGRSILSIRREHFHSMDAPREVAGGSRPNQEIESFQRHVADLFHDLAAACSSTAESGEGLLSLSWMRKLLEAFLVCQEAFKAIVLNNKELVSRSPLDRLVGEFFERSVKALDVCNAIRDGIEQVRQWQKHLEIVLVALNPSQRTVGEGQLRRAKKALTDLTIAMLDEKDAGAVLSQRNRSFGRTNNSGKNHSAGSHFRSLSWSVSRSWSAARQLQAIGNNLAPPRNNEIIASEGLAIAVYTMNAVLLFVMWALVAAIPCQDRGLQIHFSVPRNFPWAEPMTLLHDRILEESKKKDRRNSNGLLKEIHDVERCSRHLAELTDPNQFPLAEDRETELRQSVHELYEVCNSLKDGLGQLERQVREVFHRIIRNRTDCQDQPLA
ncbi:unnamed protein product [Spirodela intermedia]|uniref:Uncharacterized protein n=1 Tax=Spirodela intermedia TaxID=51605 RepID=A0A7I8KS23_SPIIN|nr:unnamed protein product [Spirodela intermedia]